MAQAKGWCRQATSHYLDQCWSSYMTPYGVTKPGSAFVQIMACCLFSAKQLPKQCWVIVKWTLMNKVQWNFNPNIEFDIHENTSENIVCEMTAILSRGRLIDLQYGMGNALCGFVMTTFSKMFMINMSISSAIRVRYEYFCQFTVWSMFCHDHYSYVCCLLYRTALQRDPCLSRLLYQLNDVRCSGNCVKEVMGYHMYNTGET